MLDLLHVHVRASLPLAAHIFLHRGLVAGGLFGRATPDEGPT